MSEGKLSIAGTRAEWIALLRALTPCSACGRPAEIVLSGRSLCVPCCAGIRRGTANSLAHADLLDRIVTATNGGFA